VTLLFEVARLLFLALLGVLPLAGDKGIATRYGDPGDRLTGKHLSCTHEPLKPDQLVCAHRTLPCGTLVLLHNPRTRRFAYCEVLDRGPFGAILPSGNWGVKIHPSEPGKWRGIIDLAPAVANALALNGRERVQLLYQRVAERLHVARGLHR
jgi:hypothetical protein